MVTLTETAYFARKGINIAAILLVVVIILRIIISVSIGLKDKYFPAPPPPATAAFGILPAINAQNNIATPAAITYTLETVTGQLPVLPISEKVYFMVKPAPSFDSFNKMKSQAAKLGFTDVPQKVTDTAWRFSDSQNPLRLLDIDEISGNFRLTYNYQSDLSIFGAKNFTSPDAVASEAKSFFGNLGLLSTDLQAGTPSSSLLQIDSGALIPATAISNADAVAVTLNRADVEGKPVVSPDARQGLVSVLISSSGDSKKRILEARYFYSGIDLENFATYPLITSTEAWEKLKVGKAIFASLPIPAPPAIMIRNVYLAYLDPYPPQSFIQPVLVFSDQKGFVAYVPVITSEWTQ